jgi:hypothetical protein
VIAARPASRFEWEQSVLRARWTGLIKGNGTGTRGGVSGAVFRAVAWALCTHADADGSNVRPGDATVAALAEVGVKNVRAVKGALLDYGFLERTKGGARRPGGGDAYRLTLPTSTVAGVPVLSQSALRGEIERLSDSEKSRKKRGLEPLLPGPLDPEPNAVVPGPVDPKTTLEPGPPDPERKSGTGSGGPSNQAGTGSSGPAVPGPVDRHTNHDQTTTTNKTAAVEANRDARAQRNGVLFAATRKVSQPLRLILDELADEAITEDEGRKVQSVWTATAKPRGIGLYERVAGEGGIPWRTILADVRAHAKAETAAAVEELTNFGPPCVHGQPGGDHPHPTTGKLLCPLCRRGAPAPVHEPDPVGTYRQLHTAAHGAPSRERMTEIAHQRQHLAKKGLTAAQIQAIAAGAAVAGQDLATYLRAEQERLSA